MSLKLRGRYWHYAFTDSTGKRHRGSTNETYKRDAERIETQKKAELEAEIREHGRTGSKRVMSAVDVFELAWREHYINQTQARTVSGHIDHFQGFWVEQKFHDITNTSISDFVAYHLTRVSPATVGKYLETLRKVFNMAELKWDIRCQKIHWDTHKQQKAPARDVRLTRDEQKRLLLALNHRMRPVVEFAFMTALRQGNILNMKWSDVRFENNEIKVQVKDPNVKGGRTYMLPMSQDMRAFLLRLKDKAVGEYVFPQESNPNKPYAWVHRDWKAALKRAGIENGYRFHDIRHNVARDLHDAGVPLTSIQKLLGHLKITTTMDYIGAADIEAVRDALERLSAK